MNHFNLPPVFYLTAASDHISEGMLADSMQLDIRHVRGMLSFARDLIISRAIEAGYVPHQWVSRYHSVPKVLDELSRACSGHWSKLLTDAEREERRHAQFVLRVTRRQYQPERNNHVI